MWRMNINVISCTPNSVVLEVFAGARKIGTGKKLSIPRSLYEEFRSKDRFKSESAKKRIEGYLASVGMCEVTDTPLGD